MRSIIRPLVLGLAVASVACMPAPTTPGGSGGGGSGAAGRGGSGSGTGGSTGGSNAAGGTGGSGPTAGTGGSSSAGGSGGSGTGGSAGTGGSGTGGSGGATGGTGGSGGSGTGDTGAPVETGGGDAGGNPSARPPKPSPGCGKANPATGTRMISTGGLMTNYVVNLPMGYDPNKPWPLGFAFHGFGNGVCTGECAGFRDLKAVTVFPKSVSAGWEGGALANNITVFEALVALMKNEYCIDENRIFVGGTSSGGQFTEHLACRFGDWLWQVSPVAAFVDRGTDMGCKGTPPALIIHGVTDRAGNFGQAVAEMFAKRNGCAAAAPAGLPEAKTALMAAFNARQAMHRCFDWAGCTANPVRYCLSSQITYNNLTHGWPRIGGMLIAEFQAGLK